MKHSALILLGFILLIATVSAQSTDKALERNRSFTGATATRKSCRAIFQLDSNDPKIIGKAIRNINNALADPRLAGKIQVELIAFAGGTEAYFNGSPYEADLKRLIEKGVIVAQCNNTLKERNINRDQLYDFIAIVPSGTGELIIRQAEGWSVIKP
jgi:intracellular sulfur oxidation DsrE/DsrF family protein